MRGPTVRFDLPDAYDTDRIVLTLEAEDGRGSEYELLYRPKKKERKLRQLNV